MSNLGGLDFTKLKIKAVLLAVMLIYVPDFTLYPHWEKTLEELNQDLQGRNQKLNSLQRKLSESDNLEKQIRELQVQEENLGKKLLAVKQAISEKKNPSALLLYVAKNVPNDLWIKELVIQDGVMRVTGEALNYNSIGTFITNLRSSVFISSDKIVETKTADRKTDKRRVETFVVEFGIARYDQ